MTLATFLAGSIVAPFSHYIFMATSDFHAAMEVQTTGHEDHHQPAGHHAPTHHASYGQQALASTQAPFHYVCEYADLFANFVASHPDEADHFNDLNYAILVSDCVEVFYTEQSLRIQPRAPPVS